MMRPESLFTLFSPVTSLNGVGPRISKLIEVVAGKNVVDLFWHLPSGVIDRRYTPKLAEADEGTIATLTVTIDHHNPPRIRRLPYKVICSDETGSITLVFFNGREKYLKSINWKRLFKLI